MSDLSQITCRKESDSMALESNKRMYRIKKTIASIIKAVNPKLEEKV